MNWVAGWCVQSKEKKIGIAQFDKSIRSRQQPLCCPVSESSPVHFCPTHFHHRWTFSSVVQSDPRALRGIVHFTNLVSSHLALVVKTTLLLTGWLNTKQIEKLQSKLWDQTTQLSWRLNWTIIKKTQQQSWKHLVAKLKSVNFQWKTQITK